MYLIASTDVEPFEVAASSGYSAYGFIPNTRTIYQMQSLQELASRANLRQCDITNSLTIQQGQLRQIPTFEAKTQIRTF